MIWTSHLAGVLFLVAATAQAQPAIDRAPLSIGFGLGPSVGGGVHVSGAVMVRRGRGVGAVRLSGTEFGPLISAGLFESTRDYTQDLSLLGGVSQPLTARWRAVGLVGVSANQTTQHEAGSCFPTFLGCIPGNGTSDRLGVRVGLPVEVGVYGPVVGAFGIGVRAFANVNADQSYAGASVDLRLNPARGTKPDR